MFGIDGRGYGPRVRVDLYGQAGRIGPRTDMVRGAPFGAYRTVTLMVAPVIDHFAMPMPDDERCPRLWTASRHLALGY